MINGQERARTSRWNEVAVAQEARRRPGGSAPGPEEADVARRTRGRFLAAASSVVVVVLLALAGVAVLSVGTIRSYQRETEDLAAEVTAWRELQLVVAEQGFAEAGYRRAPSGPGARAPGGGHDRRPRAARRGEGPR